MAKISLKGFNLYMSELEALDRDTEKMIGEAIYEGTNPVANNVKSALENLHVDNSSRKGYRTSITQVAKNGLIESFGVAPMRDDNGFVNVKIGFDGYNKIGQPNVMIARALESGTSFMPKNPIISQAVKQSRKECLNKMQKSLEKNYKRIMK